MSDGQSAIANQIIPTEYKTYFQQLITTDPEIKSVIDWVVNLPDLTQEEWQKQSSDFTEILANFKKRE